MKLLVCVDGAAGPSETREEYLDSHWDSFVRRFSNRPVDRAWYCRASRIGTESMWRRCNEIVDYIHTRISPDDEISFVGYSRGAAICLLAAKRLCERDWFQPEQLKSMGLLDAVANDRLVEHEVATFTLPYTRVYHAKRMADWSSIEFPRLRFDTGQLTEQEYPVSHFAMGGTTTDYCLRAYEWVAENLLAEGAIR